MIQKWIISLSFSVWLLPEEHGVIRQQYFHSSSAAHRRHIHDFCWRFTLGHMQVSAHLTTVDLSRHASSFRLGRAHRLQAGYVTPVTMVMQAKHVSAHAAPLPPTLISLKGAEPPHPATGFVEH